MLTTKLEIMITLSTGATATANGKIHVSSVARFCTQLNDLRRSIRSHRIYPRITPAYAAALFCPSQPSLALSCSI